MLSLWTGALYLFECPVAPVIPVYVMVCGILALMVLGLLLLPKHLCAGAPGNMILALSIISLILLLVVSVVYGEWHSSARWLPQRPGSCMFLWASACRLKSVSSFIPVTRQLPHLLCVSSQLQQDSPRHKRTQQQHLPSYCNGQGPSHSGEPEPDVSTPEPHLAANPEPHLKEDDTNLGPKWTRWRVSERCGVLLRQDRVPVRFLDHHLSACVRSIRPGDRLLFISLHEVFGFYCISLFTSSMIEVSKGCFRFHHISNT